MWNERKQAKMQKLGQRDVDHLWKLGPFIWIAKL